MVGDSGQRHRLSKSKDAEAREARVQVKDGGEGLKLARGVPGIQWAVPEKRDDL